HDHHPGDGRGIVRAAVRSGLLCRLRHWPRRSGRGHPADLGLPAGAPRRVDRRGALPVDFDRGLVNNEDGTKPMSAAQTHHSLNQYSIGLDKTPANYVPLTPLSFLARTAAIYPNHVSTVYERS